MKQFLSLSFLLVLFLSIPGIAQEKCVFYLGEPEEPISLDSCWIYHKGDSLHWADTDYDDRHWKRISTHLFFSAFDSTVFSGKGWFRLHFELDSALIGRILAFNVHQHGASEIFLDGKRIHRVGTIGSDRQREKVRNPYGMPLLFRVENGGVHILAIRYSNEGGFYERTYFHENSAGFFVRVELPEIIIRNMVYEIIPLNIIVFLLSVFIVLGGLHLLLFIFYHQKRSNLFFSLFSLLFSMVLFNLYVSNGVAIHPVLENRMGFFMKFFLPYTLPPLLAIIHTLLYKRPPVSFWLVLAVSVVLSVLYLLRVDYINTIYVVYFLFGFFEIARVIILAIHRKKRGAWILGSGMLLFIMFFATMIILAIVLGSFNLDENNPWTWLVIISILVAVLSIPVSMSIFLAYDFASTNRNLSRQLVEVKRLSALTLEQEREKKKILENQKEKLEVLVKQRTSELENEKELTEKLLHNILPDKVVKELKEKGITDPEYFKDVTVFFSDIVGFTSISEKLGPELLIRELNELFTAFDDIMVSNGCERIKTIGDAYLAVCGMPEANPLHAENIASSALQIMEYIGDRNRRHDIQWHIRIGIHTGPVVGSVIGVRKYIYDVFGDTINTAARMEQHSKPLKINLSPATYSLLKDQYRFTQRGAVEIKGKGKMEMYFLED